MALQGVRLEPRAGSVRFHGRRVTKVDPEVKGATTEAWGPPNKMCERCFAGRPKCRANAEMTYGLLKTYCKLDAERRELLHRAMEELHLSGQSL